MTRWRLKRINSSTDRLDASGISIDRFRDKTPQEIECLPSAIRSSKQVGPDVAPHIGAHFSLQAETSEQDEIWIEGDLANVDRLGFRHSTGNWQIDGDVGNYLGQEMSGGMIHVNGNAGDRVGGPSSGGRLGMSGGRIEIAGNVGDEAAYRLRRGEIFIGGDAGSAAGAHMLAGTLLIAGQPGGNLGYAMQRGSILLQQPPQLPAHRFGGPIPSINLWLRLVPAAKQSAINSLIAALASSPSSAVRGDSAAAGLGEVVYLTP